MRVSREIAEQNRVNVVQTASRLFRKHGYDSISIADLMRAAGMTTGGFYKQFDDKAALIVEATQAAITANLETWTAAASSAEGDVKAATRRWYLSKTHRETVSEGCVLAALAAEAPRHGLKVQAAMTEAVQAMVEVLSEGSGEPADRRVALKDLSTMIGALVLARAVSDDRLSNELLDCASG